MKNGVAVRVYLNLHLTRQSQRPVYSVQSRQEGRWKLLGHRKVLRLRDVTFRVSESGRRRVLRERRKNVHAFVEGTLDSTVRRQPVPVTYDPYLAGHFRRRSDDLPVHSADLVSLGPQGVHISGG